MLNLILLTTVIGAVKDRLVFLQILTPNEDQSRLSVGNLYIRPVLSVASVSDTISTTPKVDQLSAILVLMSKGETPLDYFSSLRSLKISTILYLSKQMKST